MACWVRPFTVESTQPACKKIKILATRRMLASFPAGSTHKITHHHWGYFTFEQHIKATDHSLTLPPSAVLSSHTPYQCRLDVVYVCTVFNLVFHHGVFTWSDLTAGSPIFPWGIINISSAVWLHIQ